MVEVKNTLAETNGQKIAERIYEKELQKTNQKKKNRIEKVIKRKGDKLYIKWKNYDNIVV